MLFTHGYAYCVDKRIVGPWLLGLEEQVDPAMYLDFPIMELGLGTYTVNSLARRNIEIVKDLIQYTELELKRIPQLGPERVTMIKTRLSELGLSLQTSQPE